VLRKKGKDGLEEAISELEKALRLDPSDLESRVQLAICYEQKAALPEAERLLEATVHEQPNLAEAHRVLARVYYHQGKKEQGDRESAIVLKLDAGRDARGRPPMGNSSAPQSF
jgi:predicted Zn-dependent protease